MQQLDYSLLYRWFMGLGVDEPVWVPTVFTKNRDRLLDAEVARKFLAELLNHEKVRKLLSDEHFSVDGTQIQACSRGARTDDDVMQEAMELHGRGRAADHSANIGSRG